MTTKVKDKTTIYGIYHDGKVLYVGSTDRDKDSRWKEHKTALTALKHTNKTLSKYYNSNKLTIDDLDFKVLYELDNNNSLVRYTLEMFAISLYKPLCNKCVIQQSNKIISFQKCNNDNMSKEIIKAIMS